MVTHGRRPVPFPFASPPPPPPQTAAGIPGCRARRAANRRRLTPAASKPRAMFERLEVIECRVCRSISPIVGGEVGEPGREQARQDAAGDVPRLGSARRARPSRPAARAPGRRGRRTESGKGSVAAATPPSVTRMSPRSRNRATRRLGSGRRAGRSRPPRSFRGATRSMSRGSRRRSSRPTIRLASYTSSGTSRAATPASSRTSPP